MSTIRLRPRFRETLPLAMEEVLQRLRAQLDKPKAGIYGSIIDHHIILKMPPAERHYWSPQLSLELEKVEGGTLVRGLFGPKPAVWTMFMFFYAAAGFFTLMGLMYGVSQMMLGQPAWAMWSVPAGALLLLAIYIVARMGRKIGSGQMEALHMFYRDTMDGKVRSSAA